MKQDRNGVRTAQDLERKYNLSSISLIKKAVEQTETGLTKVNAELEDFINTTSSTIENLQDQIDGNITTFYYSGVPTLSNLPASEWSQSEYNAHIGDLYYDKNTGYAYRFYFDSTNETYGWMKLTDNDVVEALAIANAASDTADSKRRVFTTTPSPPYDNGDLWINNQEIYICQISKAEGETYSENDFIIATKYTDDTVANQIGEDLTIVSGRVTTIERDVSDITETLEETRYYTDSDGNQVLLSEQINKMVTSANGIENNLKSIGGNNILRNTGLWFEEVRDTHTYTFPGNELYPSNIVNPGAVAVYEYWTGYVKRQLNDNAINSTSMILQKGSLIQEQEVPNGDYCVSFTYKKINPFAIASVVINDIEYPLDSTEYSQFYTGKRNDDDDYIIEPLKVTSKRIKVHFKTNMDNSVEIYDLMCNIGPNKFIYSQNQNETTTDTVNISKGITITSSNMETIFKANANGIKILTLNEQVIAYFTEKGLSTKELIVEDEAQICGVLIQSVGDQTWFTRM
jgi:hypothetical protein